MILEWSDYMEKHLPIDVYLRYCECHSTKDDLSILVNTRWQYMLENGMDLDLTRTNALTYILDFLRDKGQFINLSPDEWYELTGEDFFIVVDEKLLRYYGNESHVVIPNNVTIVGDSAFARCTSIVSIAIPEGVTTIGMGAYFGCNNLKSVTIPRSVTTICDCAFSECYNLENVFIPDSVLEVGAYAFEEDVRLIIDKEQIRHIYDRAFRVYTKVVFDNQANNYYDSIVIDTETTGLTAGIDEILQLSIIDGNGNTLYNKYFRPIFHKTWSCAERINKISPEIMVSDCPTIEDELHNIIPIIFSAKKIIGYNTQFDLNMLESYGIYSNPNAEIIDVMRDFAPIYGEWNDKRGDWKWQKLIKCADYYNYDWGQDTAHNSLSDCKATLFCYKQIINEK